MGNDALLNIDAMSRIAASDSIDITNNSNLESVSGLSSLETVDYLYIEQNPALTSFDGLSRLVLVRYEAWLGQNDSLSSISALSSSLCAVGPDSITETTLWIYDNPSLCESDVTGLIELMVSPVWCADSDMGSWEFWSSFGNSDC